MLVFQVNLHKTGRKAKTVSMFDISFDFNSPK